MKDMYSSSFVEHLKNLKTSTVVKDTHLAGEQVEERKTKRPNPSRLCVSNEHGIVLGLWA